MQLTGLVVMCLLPACADFQAADRLRRGAVVEPEPIPDAWWPRQSAADERASRPADSDAAAADRGEGRSVRWRLPPGGQNSGLVVCVDGGVDPEPARKLADELIGRDFAVLELSLTSLAENPIDVTVLSDSDLDPAARGIAGVVDQTLAGLAYSVEREITRIAVEQPGVSRSPLVLVGFGLGAAAVPVIAARLADEPGAAVLVAGGANLFEVSQARPGHDFGIRLATPQSKLDQRRFDWVSELYLAESRLDPFHTSRFLLRMPVLQIHGRFDEVIPAWTGDLLFLRLGRPDRVSLLGDHEDVLDHAADEVEWIADWIDQALLAGIR